MTSPEDSLIESTNSIKIGPTSSEHLKLRCNTTIFEELVSEDPHKIAIISTRGTLTRNGLNERANQLAAHLRFLGIGPESVVAVSLERGLEYVVAMLAIWKAGGAYLPLDQSLPSNRMQYMISDSKASCLISIGKVIDDKSLHDQARRTVSLDDEKLIAKLKVYSNLNLGVTANHSNLAYILYTSGTTGNPKGVGITHGSLVNLIEDIRESREIEEMDRVLLFSPFCFDASIRDVNGSLMTGASLYVPQEKEILPGNLFKTITDNEITNSVITPSVLRSCKFEDLPCLKTIVLAGESAHESLIKTWGVGRRLINAYGPTEATVCATKQVYYDGHIPSGLPVLIGLPIKNTTITIVDENDVSVDSGEVGEICITGPGVSKRGYINMPQRSAECFKDNLQTQERSYKTGDLGKLLPGGEVHCLGRKARTRQIKLHGQRIEPDEIENIIRSDLNVLDAVVVARGVEPTRIMCAYVVAMQEGSLRNRSELASRLCSLLKDNLPSYSIPSTIEFIESLPLSVNKKLDEAALPSPTFDKRGPPGSVTPRLVTVLQRQVAVAILQALDLPLETDVTPDTTYAELGGTSLLASIVLRHINESVGCSIQFGQFYRHTTSIKYLAELISQGDEDRANPHCDDLAKRVKVPLDITYSAGPVRARPGAKEHVLLTGSTGFLGSHILAEIVKSHDTSVSCIVRAPDNATALRRIKQALMAWDLWDDRFSGRFDALCGDVSQPFLGLSSNDYIRLAKTIHTVYHSAAAVNFVAPFSDLEEGNVTGTVEILRFASAIVQKRLTYISTLSVFFGAREKVLHGMEAPVPDLDSDIVTGYGQSKWLSEQIVLEYHKLGGHALILRPGRLLGSTHFFKCPPDDFSIRLIASVLELGAAPDLRSVYGDRIDNSSGWQIDLTPVDYCAKAIHLFSLRRLTGIHHIINNDTISFESIVGHLKTLGSRIRQLPYREWQQLITRSTHLAPLSSVFHEAFSKEDKRSVFEILLQTPIFLHSSYSAEALYLPIETSERLGDCLPRTINLLDMYLAKNRHIFSVGDGSPLTLNMPSNHR